MLQLILLVTLMGTALSFYDESLHEMYLTMPRGEFVKHFNNQNYTWKMAEDADHISITGCVIPKPELHETLPTIRHSLEAIINAPESFDARTQWPQCESISQVYDQGHCGSCWTFGSATTASDRTCIHKDVHVNLAEQDFDCCKTNVCEGATNVEALNYWRDSGLVTQACKPYDIYKLNQTTCIKACVDSSINYEGDKHFGSLVYNVDSDIENIKAELSLNGPVVATITIFRDFYDYRGGIYQHTYGDTVGYHSVRILGYGVENGVGYWLGINSWGTEWGDSGSFKMQQGQSDIGIEKYLVTGKP